MFATAAAVIACSSDDDDDSDSGLRIVTTLPLFADMVSNVAGDRAEVDSLLPSGADPHTFEPSPRDVAKITEADVVFANGLGLEPRALKVIDANLPGDAVLMKLGDETIASGASLIPSEDNPGGNAHLWLDPMIGIEYAKIIRDTLVDADPAGRDSYEDSYDAFADLLTDTASYLTETTSAVRGDLRKIVSTHDAFDYLARAIGFEVAGFVVPGPGQDASPADIADLIAQIEELGIPAVFSEPQTDAEARALEQIADDAGVEVCTLYSDALSKTVATYVEILRFNAEELARCLGGADG
jgi:manganese/iron transport system substrate-binding protein